MSGFWEWKMAMPIPDDSLAARFPYYVEALPARGPWAVEHPFSKKVWPAWSLNLTKTKTETAGCLWWWEESLGKANPAIYLMYAGGFVQCIWGVTWINHIFIWQQLHPHGRVTWVISLSRTWHPQGPLMSPVILSCNENHNKQCHGPHFC